MNIQLQNQRFNESIYNVNYIETHEHEPHVGNLGTYPNLEKAQAAAKKHVDNWIDDELECPWTELEKIEFAADYKRIMDRKLSKWKYSKTFNEWIAYSVNSDGDGYRYTITETELKV